MVRVSLTTILILAIAFKKVISGQFYSNSCYRAGNVNNKANFPNSPPCWVHSNLELASCFDKGADGRCPSRAIDIHFFKNSIKLNTKCKSNKPITDLVEKVLLQQPSKVEAPAKQPPKYEVIPPIPSTPVLPNKPSYPSNPTDDYNVAPVPVGGVCPLPSDSNIIPVTPELGNRGWAISPDQRCEPGKWCPYTCKPGMYSAQFDQSAKVNGPSAGSMNGGLFCNAQGQLVIPFPKRPLCTQHINNVYIDNRLEGEISLCGTDYVDSKPRLIPTIAVPNILQLINTPPITYSNHYVFQNYINPINSSSKDCVLGKKNLPIGNWAPFFVGGSKGFAGKTVLKIGVNKNFVTAKIKNLLTKPYKLTIECDGPCETEVGCQITINDSINKFCVAQVPKSSKARIVLSY